MDDNTDILFCDHNKIHSIQKLDINENWKGKNSHYLRQLYHIFPVGANLRSCKFLEMSRKVHTKPITVATSGEEEGNGMARGGQRGLQLQLQHSTC